MWCLFIIFNAGKYLFYEIQFFVVNVLANSFSVQFWVHITFISIRRDQGGKRDVICLTE